MKIRAVRAVPSDIKERRVDRSDVIKNAPNVIDLLTPLVYRRHLFIYDRTHVAVKTLFLLFKATVKMARQKRTTVFLRLRRFKTEKNRRRWRWHVLLQYGVRSQQGGGEEREGDG